MAPVEGSDWPASFQPFVIFTGFPGLIHSGDPEERNSMTGMPISPRESDFFQSSSFACVFSYGSVTVLTPSRVPLLRSRVPLLMTPVRERAATPVATKLVSIEPSDKKRAMFGVAWPWADWNEPDARSRPSWRGK